MEQTGYIEHKGIVKRVVDDRILIDLINISSCSSCHVKGVCNVSDTDNKTVEVLRESGEPVKKGDEVTINYEKSLGPKALFLGYMLPFLVVMATLLITMEITGNEAVAGLISLFVLVPYYLGLFLFKDRLKTKFAFKIKSIKNQKA